jgi:hypothetical protein
MGKLVVFLGLIALAYWYWSGPYQKSTEELEAEQAVDYAAVMQQCVNQEQRMQSAGALGGIGDAGSEGADAERLCAKKNNLYKGDDGNWHSKRE